MLTDLFSPGRYYASLITKLVLAHFLLNYDFELRDPKRSLSMAWRSTVVPRSDTILLVRDRKNE